MNIHKVWNPLLEYLKQIMVNHFVNSGYRKLSYVNLSCRYYAYLLAMYELVVCIVRPLLLLFIFILRARKYVNVITKSKQLFSMTFLGNPHISLYALVHDIL